jgi:hypothetical protein
VKCGRQSNVGLSREKNRMWIQQGLPIGDRRPEAGFMSSFSAREAEGNKEECQNPSNAVQIEEAYSLYEEGG